MILVTGGAGFIGANFIHHWLAAERTTVVNLDKLTYAGNPESLADLKSDERHVFVKGDICDRALVGKLLREHRPLAIVHSPRRATSTVRSRAPPISCRPTSSARSACSRKPAVTGRI